MSSLSMYSIQSQRPIGKGKKSMEGKAKPCDIRGEYDACFPINSEEEGKKIFL